MRDLGNIVHARLGVFGTAEISVLVHMFQFLIQIMCRTKDSGTPDLPVRLNVIVLSFLLLSIP